MSVLFTILCCLKLIYNLVSLYQSKVELNLLRSPTLLRWSEL